MWLPKYGNWKNMTFKCPVNIADLTFGGSGLDYINSDTPITLSNRWIEPDAGLSTTCNVTDKYHSKFRLTTNQTLLTRLLVREKQDL